MECGLTLEFRLRIPLRILLIKWQVWRKLLLMMTFSVLFICGSNDEILTFSYILPIQCRFDYKLRESNSIVAMSMSVSECKKYVMTTKMEWKPSSSHHFINIRNIRQFFSLFCEQKTRTGMEMQRKYSE